MYVRALAGWEKALGPDHTSTLSTVNNLGLLYRDQGKLAEAEQMYQRALLGLQNSSGSEHPSTMIIMNNMKTLDLGNGKEAAKRANPVVCTRPDWKSSAQKMVEI